MSDGLKLKAEDAEDLRVMAAVLQDSLVPISDMQFLPDERRFVLVANRFRWENCDDVGGPVGDENAPAATPVKQAAAASEALDPAFEPCSAYERVNCGICFEGVRAVRRKGFSLQDRGRILELLTIECEGDGIVVVFADGAMIRLEGAAIRCHLKDLGEPWPTRWRPHHPVEDAV